MNENIPQTSASERVEAAREALAVLRTTIDGPHPANSGLDSFTLGHVSHALDGTEAALRALITPPSVGESEEAIAERIADGAGIDWDEAYDVALVAVRASIQSAHETWEPADRPSQEQMLRWLELDYRDDGSGAYIVIFHQLITREVI